MHRPHASFAPRAVPLAILTVTTLSPLHAQSAGAGLTAQDVAEVANGALVTRVRDVEDQREVVMIGAGTWPGTLGRFLEHALDIGNFVSVANVRHLGIVRPEFRRADLQALTFPSRDAREFRDCDPGACDLKLPAELLAADDSLPFDPMMRGWLAEYLAGYLAVGADAMVVYADQHQPQPSGRAFATLVERTAKEVDLPPAFRSAILAAPTAQSGAEHRFYWSVEGTGLRPITALWQVTVFADSAHGEAWVALKQLYASHYLQAALKLFHASATTDATGHPLLHVRLLERSLFDTELGGIKRPIIEIQMEDHLRHRLEMLRQRVGAGDTRALLKTSGSSSSPPDRR
jgi:hypothetical protein